MHHMREWLQPGCFCCFLGKLCIEVSPADKIAFISEELCIGCGICAKVSLTDCCVDTNLGIIH
jgi:translation initiation factor RLI1